MITKQRRPNQYFGNDQVDLKVVDKHGKSFIMTVGGNLDLYWIPENHSHDRPEDEPYTLTYEFDKSDPLLFETLTEIFKKIEENDNEYSPSIKDNVFTFISEDYPEEDANILKIRKAPDRFFIDFIGTPVVSVWGNFKRGCNICFCNSGSRVPKIEQLFMLKFNELAYYNNEIQMGNL